MGKINTKVAALSTAQLKEMAVQLNGDFRDGVEIVFSAVLNALEARLPEDEFVTFCEGME